MIRLKLREGFFHGPGVYAFQGDDVLAISAQVDKRGYFEINSAGKFPIGVFARVVPPAKPSMLWALLNACRRLSRRR